MNVSIDEVAAIIKHRPYSKNPVLIAIEGFGGSGKTTIANTLAKLLGSSYIVSIDDFIIKEKVLDSSWDKGAFDRKRLERQILIPASKGTPPAYEKLLWDSNTLSDLISVPRVDYLIIEGISSFHPDIVHYYDYTIWIDTPIDVAKSRGRARDSGNENENKWDQWAQNDIKYQEQFHPELKASFIIHN